MKKLMVMTLAAAMLTVPALADDHEGHKGSKGHKGGFMFEKLDTDGDGSVSKEEFLRVHEERFTKMDTNGDGVISKEEIEAAKAEWKGKMKERRASKKTEPKDEPAAE
jgi:Ca2+-binding EF-hand superfamily protein